MTDTSGPWDGVAWAEAEWYRYVSAALPSGVIGTDPGAVGAGELAWSASGLNVTIGTGRAFVGGSWFERSGTPPAAAVTANGTAQARIDRFVLRRDTATHTTTVTRIQGTPAASPSAPSITRTDTVWDLQLFRFTVPANNGTTLTGVTDERSWMEAGTADESGDVTVTGNLTVNGTASGNSPTADGHFATRGYVIGRTKSKTGSASPTSNSSGVVTITHGLGVLPDAVFIQARGTAQVRPYGFMVTAKTSSTFTYRVYYDNLSLDNTQHDIYWRVEQSAS